VNQLDRKIPLRRHFFKKMRISRNSRMKFQRIKIHSAQNRSGLKNLKRRYHRNRRLFEN
jgi:hypothetical protein